MMALIQSAASGMMTRPPILLFAASKDGITSTKTPTTASTSQPIMPITPLPDESVAAKTVQHMPVHPYTSSGYAA